MMAIYQNKLDEHRPLTARRLASMRWSFRRTGRCRHCEGLGHRREQPECAVCQRPWEPDRAMSGVALLGSSLGLLGRMPA